MVASSVQNGSTLFGSCEVVATSQSASVRRIAATSSESFALRDTPHPAATAIASVVVMNSLKLATVRLLRGLTICLRRIYHEFYQLPEKSTH